MATTSSNLTAGKIAGKVANQGGNRHDGRFGLKAKLATGVAILGCAAALAFGGLRGSEGAQSPAVAPVAPAAQANGRTQQLFMEQNHSLPDSGTTASGARAQQLFQELNTQLPTSGTSSGTDHRKPVERLSNTTGLCPASRRASTMWPPI